MTGLSATALAGGIEADRVCEAVIPDPKDPAQEKCINALSSDGVYIHIVQGTPGPAGPAGAAGQAGAPGTNVMGGIRPPNPQEGTVGTLFLLGNPNGTISGLRKISPTAWNMDPEFVLPRGSKNHFGEEAPDPKLGSVGDGYLQPKTGEFWVKAESGWISTRAQQTLDEVNQAAAANPPTDAPLSKVKGEGAPETSDPKEKAATKAQLPAHLAKVAIQVIGMEYPMDPNSPAVFKPTATTFQSAGEDLVFPIINQDRPFHWTPAPGQPNLFGSYESLGKTWEVRKVSFGNGGNRFQVKDTTFVPPTVYLFRKGERDGYLTLELVAQEGNIQLNQPIPLENGFSFLCQGDARLCGVLRLQGMISEDVPTGWAATTPDGKHRVWVQIRKGHDGRVLYRATYGKQPANLGPLEIRGLPVRAQVAPQQQAVVPPTPISQHQAANDDRDCLDKFIRTGDGSCFN